MKGQLAQQLNAQPLPSFRGIGFGNANPIHWPPDRMFQTVSSKRIIHHRSVKASHKKHKMPDGTIPKTHGHGLWDAKKKEFIPVK